MICYSMCSCPFLGPFFEWQTRFLDFQAVFFLLRDKYKYDPVGHLPTILSMSSEYGPYWVCDVCDDLIVLGQRKAHNDKCPGKLIRVIIPGVTGVKDGLPVEKEKKPLA